MSNHVTMLATKFEDCNGTSYGWRLYDTYGQDYCNTLSEEEYNQARKDPKEFFRLVLQSESETSISILESLFDSEKSVDINDVCVESETIQEWLAGEGVTK